MSGIFIERPTGSIHISSQDQLPNRRLNFPDPHSWTDHAEITNTNNCYLIAAEEWCEGCTAVNPQNPEEAMTYQGSDRMPRIDVDKVIEAHEAMKRIGINLVTDMGGENLTIPGYEDVVTSIGNDPIFDGLVYSSSMYFLKPDGTPNKIFAKYENVGLFSGGMYLLSSVDRLLTSKDQIPSNADGSYPKALAGLQLMDYLVNHGFNTYDTLGIHMVIRRTNIDQIRPLYEWASERGLWFSYCDLVYGPYTSRRKNPVPESFYADRLRKEDVPRLQEIFGEIVEEESQRLRQGKSVRTIPSSAFARMSMTLGPENGLNCRIHRAERLPNTFDIHPSGQIRACIAQNTVEDVEHCSGCAYISIDRGHSDYVPFETSLFGAMPGDVVWRNAIVNRKHSAFRQDRKNLAFTVEADGTIAPLYKDVIYYDRERDLVGRSVVRDGRDQLTDERYYTYPKPGNLFLPDGGVIYNSLKQHSLITL